MADPTDKVIDSQNTAHGVGHDYVKGSPHLRHPQLRSMIESRLHSLVGATVARQGTCHVLEVGAGHGTFTDFLLEAGARVTVTEASAASATMLTAKYAHRDDVEVFFDHSGEEVFATADRYDAVVCASLLHHIPDYVSFVRQLGDLIRPGGWFYSVQDPMYYPRRTTTAHLASRGAYFLWRLGQGNVRRGVATRIRRAKGTYSESEPSDLVEYHVVRSGVDERALEVGLNQRFAHVEVFTYWSTQSPLLQRLFARSGLHSDFGLVATDRLPVPDAD